MENKNTRNSNRKVPHWFPYTSEITMSGKKSVTFEYKGGTCDTSFARIHSILFYGSVCDLSQEFLEKCSRFRIPVCIHRRNIGEATWVLPSTGPRHNNALTKQILYRQNNKKCAYISRRLLKTKFKSMEWLINSFRFPKKWQPVKEMRHLEARHGRKFWDSYYRKLGYNHSQRRENSNEVSKALNAVSKFVSGIILRWVLYHRLSPYHGFLHQTVYIGIFRAHWLILRSI